MFEYGRNGFCEISRITYPRITITTDGRTIRIERQNGFIEGIRTNGDIGIVTDEKFSDLPIVKDFNEFIARMNKKYFTKEARHGK